MIRYQKGCQNNIVNILCTKTFIDKLFLFPVPLLRPRNSSQKEDDLEQKSALKRGKKINDYLDAFDKNTFYRFKTSVRPEKVFGSHELWLIHESNVHCQNETTSDLTSSFGNFVTTDEHANLVE